MWPEYRLLGAEMPGKVRELKLKFSYLLLWLQSVAKELINNPFIFILQSYGTWTYMGFTWVILLFHIQLEVRLSRRSRMALFFWYLGFRIFLVAPACNAGDLGLIRGSQRSSGEGDGIPLEDSSLENPRDRGAWRAAVHGVAKSQTQLSD